MGSNNKFALRTYLERGDISLLMKINTLLQSPLSHSDFLELAEVVCGFMPEDEKALSAQEKMAMKKLRGAEGYRRHQQRIQPH